MNFHQSHAALGSPEALIGVLIIFTFGSRRDLDGTMSYITVAQTDTAGTDAHTNAKIGIRAM